MPLNIEEVTEEIKTYLEKKNEDRNTMIWNLLNEAKTEHKRENWQATNFIPKEMRKVDGAKPKVSRRKERSERK